MLDFYTPYKYKKVYILLKYIYCMEYKEGDVVFFNWNNPYAKIIRLYNKLTYGNLGWAHVGIITEVQKDKVLIYEALYKGFTDIAWNGEKNYYTKSGLEDLISKNQVLIKSPIKKLEDIKEHSDKYLGLDYAFTDILNIITGTFFDKRFFKPTAYRMTCGEVVARILYDASNGKLDISSEFDKHFDEIAPMDLFISKQMNI